LRRVIALLKVVMKSHAYKDEEVEEITLGSVKHEVRSAAIAEIRAALAPFQRGNRVPMGGAIWIVSARA